MGCLCPLCSYTGMKDEDLDDDDNDDNNNELWL